MIGGGGMAYQSLVDKITSCLKASIQIREIQSSSFTQGEEGFLIFVVKERDLNLLFLKKIKNLVAT